MAINNLKVTVKSSLFVIILTIKQFVFNVLKYSYIDLFGSCLQLNI